MSRPPPHSGRRKISSGSAYLNFIGDEGEDRVVNAFGAKAYARLQALKDRYDPGNLFRLNHNVKPSGALIAEGAAAALFDTTRLATQRIAQERSFQWQALKRAQMF